jgi:hypothetical protein
MKPQAGDMHPIIWGIFIGIPIKRIRQNPENTSTSVYSFAIKIRLLRRAIIFILC